MFLYVCDLKICDIGVKRAGRLRHDSKHILRHHVGRREPCIHTHTTYTTMHYVYQYFYRSIYVYRYRYN